MRLKRKAEVISFPEMARYTKKKIEVCEWKETSSPFMTGIIKPILVLPQKELSEEQKNNILRHEITHFERRDILYKMFANLVRCVHWFNPAAWYAMKQIEEECEISCDMRVVENMNEADIKGYINTILELLPIRNEIVPVSTNMTGGKKSLMRRFKMIKNRKATNKIISALSIGAAVVLFSSILLVSGVAADSVKNDYNIMLTDKNENIILENKPFVYDNTIYLPLREMLEKKGEKVKDLTYNNGYVQFFVYPEEPVEFRGEKYDYWINRVRIGNTYAYIQGHSEGSTENDEILRAPVLKDDRTYVPYDFIEKLKKQGLFENISVTADNAENLSGILYRNDDLNVALELPLDWAGKYLVREYDGSAEFIQSATYNKYGDGSGLLFSVVRINIDEYNDDMNYESGGKLIYKDSRYAYMRFVPTDVQYPIWVDSDEEGAQIAAEYEELFKGIEFMENHFKTIFKWE